MVAEYLVNSTEKAETKRHTKYLRMKLYAAGGKLYPAVMWEDKEPPPVGRLIEVLADEEDYHGEKQLNVKAFRILDKPVADVFLPRTPYNVDELFVELQTFIEEVQDHFLRPLLRFATRDDEKRWKRGVAAKSVHHAYLGGLLEHTVNLLRLAKAVAGLYPRLNRDYLYTAAVLHDIGKMDEMACELTIEYTTDGELLGHIVIGLLRADKIMDTITGFPPELRLIVRHLIISHHGSTQYGSPKSPAMLEAQVFNCLDGIDANIGKIFAAIDKAGPGKEWSANVEWDKRFYLGPVKKEESSNAGS